VGNTITALNSTHHTVSLTLFNHAIYTMQEKLYLSYELSTDYLELSGLSRLTNMCYLILKNLVLKDNVDFIHS